MSQPVQKSIIGYGAAVNTDDLCIADMGFFLRKGGAQADQVLIDLAARLEKAIKDLHAAGYKSDILIQYRNIIDFHHNPDGRIGFFRVMARP